MSHFFILHLSSTGSRAESGSGCSTPPASSPPGLQGNSARTRGTRVAGWARASREISQRDERRLDTCKVTCTPAREAFLARKTLLDERTKEEKTDCLSSVRRSLAEA